MCARQLKSVRRQFNEHDALRRTLSCMTITLASYGVVFLLLEENHVLQRRIVIVCEFCVPSPRRTTLSRVLGRHVVELEKFACPMDN